MQKWYFSLALLIYCGFHLNDALPCIPKYYPEGMLCVCNVTYCDTLDNLGHLTADNAIIVSSSRDGLRFEVQHMKFSRLENGHKTDVLMVKLPPITATVEVNRKSTYQKMVGFGGAFTGSVSLLLSELPQTVQHFVYKSYYSHTQGIGYNMMRIPIGGSDFDIEPWAYNEEPINDEELSDFHKLDQRDLIRISQIKDLQNVADNNDIKLIGSTWMKTNNAWTGFSFLLPQYYQTWAEYHLRYLELMAEENIWYWAITTGNEPMNGSVVFALFAHFMSLGWTAEDQGLWVGNNLGPLLRNSNFKNVKLFGGDDERIAFPWWFQQMEKGHDKAIDFLDGFANHWYLDAAAPPQVFDDTHMLFPEKVILYLESSVGTAPLEVHGPVLGSWSRAEKYITSYIEDFQHWISGWVDWNLILDENGAAKEFYKQPMFYGIGHMSRFIEPDSIRLEVVSTHYDILAIGFKRPDNSIVIVLYNNSERKADINLIDTDKHIQLLLPPKSIHTLLYI